MPCPAPFTGRSADQQAFAHYLRTGERLTRTEWLARHEVKFNPWHDRLGRFTFGPGGAAPDRGPASLASRSPATSPAATRPVRQSRSPTPKPPASGFLSGFAPRPDPTRRPPWQRTLPTSRPGSTPIAPCSTSATASPMRRCSNWAGAASPRSTWRQGPPGSRPVRRPPAIIWPSPGPCRWAAWSAKSGRRPRRWGLPDGSPSRSAVPTAWCASSSPTATMRIT